MTHQAISPALGGPALEATLRTGLLRTGLHLTGLLLLSLLTGTATGAEDRLSTGPAPWDNFIPVPLPDTSALNKREAQRLHTLRQDLNDKIRQHTAQEPLRSLAEPMGTLCALYQIHDMRSIAEPCYRNAQTLNPEDVRWFYYPAWLSLKSGRYEQALIRLDAVRKRVPDYPTLNLRLAEAHHSLNQFDQARPFLDQALKQPGTQARAHWILGQINLLERHPDRAITHFQHALQAQPDAKAIHYPLAQAYRAIGNRDLALKHLKQRGKQEPQAKDPLLDALKALGDPAQDHFNKAMKAVLKRDYDSAATEFGEGLSLSPDNPHAQISYGRARMLTGQTDVARKAFTKAIELLTQQAKDTSLAEFFLALTHHHSGDHDTAKIHYQNALKARPDQPGANYFLGLILRHSQDPVDQGQAASLLARVADQDSQNTVAALQQLLALQQAGANDQTLQRTLEERLQQAPQNPVLKYAQTRLLALSQDPRVQDPKRALSDAQALSQAYPGPQTALLLALSEAANGRFQSAIQGYANIIKTIRQSGRAALAVSLATERDMLSKRQLPDAYWPQYDPVFTDPKPDTLAPFREYPAAKPF